MRSPRNQTLFFLFLAGFCLLQIGAITARREYLTRGIPDEMPEPTVGAGIRLGIVVDLSQYDDFALAQELERMKDAGISHIRQSFYHTPQPDWSLPDRIIPIATEHGLTLVPLLDGDPSTNFTPPANPNSFGEWAGEFANRYGEIIDHYIIWNEPNISSHWGNNPVNAAEYAALLTAAANAIHTQDSQALIIAAPLAPTIETGPDNIADPLYLQLLYESGAATAFDIAAGKPYGFDSSPDNRAVNQDVLNFSRIILLREVMLRNGDAGKAIWAGNWGWNSLPTNWSGRKSLWGESSAADRAAWTIEAIKRARLEWPWMGVMFLENWEPKVPASNPRWGFAVKNSGTELALQELAQADRQNKAVYPGFYLAQAKAPGQFYRGGWRFSPDFGADISGSGDFATFDFVGTDAALRVRRADFRARFYVTIDGHPANKLPPTEDNRATLILTAADPAEDYVTNEIVASNLQLGAHSLALEAYRGWDQWALNGFSVAYRPSTRNSNFWMMGLSLAAISFTFLAIKMARQTNWGTTRIEIISRWQQMPAWRQLLLNGLTASVVAVFGWLTWGEESAGIFRRLDGFPFLAMTATTASIFYFLPTFFIYAAALIILILLLALKPARGIALVAFSLPFYIIPKPMLGYRFSPVEVFILAAFAGTLINKLGVLSKQLAVSSQQSTSHFSLLTANWKIADISVLFLTFIATISLFFTNRLDVATNEWRVVIVEPALFYLLLRLVKLEKRDVWLIVDAFVLGGLIVALIGLGQYFQGSNLITAELGLPRLRSIYGSPNNAALYLGRIVPLLAGIVLLGCHSSKRRLAYTLLLIPIGLAALLTVSKGMIFLGMPASLLTIFIYWRKLQHKNPWRWVAAFITAGFILLLIALQIPPLAARLNPQGATGFLRINLWRASLNMAADNPFFGVGLDNFLYEYRGRYILDAAWKEPHLNHPHNIFLDFTTRLGGLGLIAGIFLFASFWRVVRQLPRKMPAEWQGLALGMLGAFVYILAHGLVDHSFFLIDLAGTFYLLLGLVIWLNNLVTPDS